MSRRNHDFQAIRSEGGLLPPDLLRRLLDPQTKLEGMKPEDYGLPPDERLNGIITQSWTRLRKHWTEFRSAASKLPENDPAIGLTNDKWNLPLLRELGFGLLPTTTALEINGRTYAINRFLGSVPLHLIGCGLSLDRRAAGVRGAASANPHGLVQEFLNRSPGHQWAILSNGLRLRILRDNATLSRQSFLEFDLEAMFDGEVYSDFVLLWLVAHATRFAPHEDNKPDSCWIEDWTKVADKDGTRALGDLRVGVEKALQVLGEGFTSHPKNNALRDALRSNRLPLSSFHGELLRVVYRCIFLFVADDRTIEGQPLLHPRDESEAAQIARERYAAHYSTARLRDMAGRIKGSRHGDLWRQFQLLVGALSGDQQFAAVREQLALPALGSFLWDPNSTSDLNNAELTNHDLLEAIRNLAFTRQGKVLRPVDYRNLGAEELGGVYESLLALTPQISADGARFSFAEFAGSERKTSGSYYTPDSLVQCLLDSALDPVVDEALKGKTGADAENAILALKVCDPAVGSGHFLVGAAHRLARHLARVRALAQGESEPSPLLYQQALRDVISKCLYGVDINPMAAELCRVSLWLEALEPGKPLSFLDHHIQCGNSLLGTTPALIENRIPDEAFTALEGDDKAWTTALKKRNKQEREGQTSLHGLFAREPSTAYGNLSENIAALDRIADDSLDTVKSKEETYHRLSQSTEYLEQKLVADAWCAAFTWQKTKEFPEAITTSLLHKLQSEPKTVNTATKEQVCRYALQYQFFHWHLAFPDVFKIPAEGETPENAQIGCNGGFAVVLGNPPWERIRLEEKQWFSSRSTEIASSQVATSRKHTIANLRTHDPALWAEFHREHRKIEAEKQLLSQSGRYPLCGKGDINTYAIFAELNKTLISTNGRAGFIVQSEIVTAKTYSDFFISLLSTARLVSFYDFVNVEGLFPSMHRTHPHFCLLTIAGRSTGDPADFSFWNSNVAHLRDSWRHFSLTVEDVKLVNPETPICPIFRTRYDAALVMDNHRRFKPLVDGSWDAKITRMLHGSDDSDLFRLTRDGDNLPVYEAKFIWQFDHRFATFEGNTRDVLALEKIAPTFSIKPQFWADLLLTTARFERHLRQWHLVYRVITNSSNNRTLVASIIPKSAVVNTANLIILKDAIATAEMVTLLNSFVLDYLVRNKIGGASLNKFILQQLPLPSPTQLRTTNPIEFWRYGLELCYTSFDLAEFAAECDYHGPPFKWDESRRFLIRCELDAAYFHLYGIERDDVDYILETFPIVKRKDMERYGEYRTKSVILEIYDEMARVSTENVAAVAAGRQATARYQTRLDPPPGPPGDAQGNFIPLAQWERANWPPHIHQPMEAVVVPPEEVPMATFAAYPATEADKAICAAALAVVEQSGGISSMEHLDALLLATHPDWCKTFLDNRGKAAFDKASKSAPNALFVGQNQSLRWKECRDYLEKLGAITVAHGAKGQDIGIGSALVRGKAYLPAGADAVVKCALAALDLIREIRKDLTSVPQAQRSILHFFAEQHRQYELAA